MLDKLVVEVHSVKIRMGFGRVTTKGRPLSVMAHLKKKSIVYSQTAYRKIHSLNILLLILFTTVTWRIGLVKDRVNTMFKHYMLQACKSR